MTPADTICCINTIVRDLEEEKQSWRNWLNPFWPSLRVMFNQKIKRYIRARKHLEKKYGTSQ
jgi:hypothetical protein